MQKVKKYRHMKVQVQKKKKWWAHEGSCFEKKEEQGKIAMFQNNRLYRERSYLQKEYSFKFTIFPHTCMSWSKSMTLLSLDPRFDFTTYAIPVCYLFLPKALHKPF